MRRCWHLFIRLGFLEASSSLHLVVRLAKVNTYNSSVLPIRFNLRALAGPVLVLLLHVVRSNGTEIPTLCSRLVSVSEITDLAPCTRLEASVPWHLSYLADGYVGIRQRLRLQPMFETLNVY
jgi:hypothetical protein